MTDIIPFLNEIDSQRLMRARELSEIKARFGGEALAGPYGIASKAVAVMAYAHWEGFYNDCVRTYITYFKSLGRRVQDIEWMMLVGIFGAEMQRLQDRNHSPEARCDFVSALQVKLFHGFEKFDSKVVEARSNLDFAKLTYNYKILNFDISRFQPKRIRIDKELVGWRHGVAHGSNPDLSKLDISSHIDFTSKLLLELSDQFQDALVARI